MLPFGYEIDLKTTIVVTVIWLSYGSEFIFWLYYNCWSSPCL